MSQTPSNSGLSRRRFLFSTVALGASAVVSTSVVTRALAAPLKLEKDVVKLGFIKLTDMAPLAIAQEKGFFEDEGLQVSLEAQANWKVNLDRVITGELDGAHMLAGQPIGATIGFGTKADVITPLSMDLNGNAITVSNAVWAEMKKTVPAGPDGKPVHPISAASLKPVIDKDRKSTRLNSSHSSVSRMPSSA